MGENRTSLVDPDDTVYDGRDGTVHAAIQAAWMANADHVAIEIAQRYEMFGLICMRCTVSLLWDSRDVRWTLCSSCAYVEIKQLGDRRFPADTVRAFQQQWTAEHPEDPLIADGIVGIATMVRGWRPYHTYGVT